jgi:hypothetical protein
MKNNKNSRVKKIVTASAVTSVAISSMVGTMAPASAEETIDPTDVSDAVDPVVLDDDVVPAEDVSQNPEDVVKDTNSGKDVKVGFENQNTNFVVDVAADDKSLKPWFSQSLAEALFYAPGDSGFSMSGRHLYGDSSVSDMDALQKLETAEFDAYSAWVKARSEAELAEELHKKGPGKPLFIKDGKEYWGGLLTEEEPNNGPSAVESSAKPTVEPEDSKAPVARSGTEEPSENRVIAEDLVEEDLVEEDLVEEDLVEEDLVEEDLVEEDLVEEGSSKEEQAQLIADAVEKRKEELAQRRSDSAKKLDEAWQTLLEARKALLQYETENPTDENGEIPSGSNGFIDAAEWANLTNVTITRGDGGYLPTEWEVKKGLSVRYKSDKASKYGYIPFIISAPSAGGKPTQSLILLPREHPLAKIPAGKHISYSPEGLTPYYPELAERLGEIKNYLTIVSLIDDLITRILSGNPNAPTSVKPGFATPLLVPDEQYNQYLRPKSLASSAGFNVAIDSAKSDRKSRTFIISQANQSRVQFGSDVTDYNGADKFIDDAFSIFGSGNFSRGEKDTKARVNRGYTLYGISTTIIRDDEGKFVRAEWDKVSYYVNLNKSKNLDKPWLADSGLSTFSVNIPLPAKMQRDETTITWNVNAYDAPYDRITTTSHREIDTLNALYRTKEITLSDTLGKKIHEKPKDVLLNEGFINPMSNSVPFKQSIATAKNADGGMTVNAVIQPVSSDYAKYTMMRYSEKGVVKNLFINRDGSGFDVTFLTNQPYLSMFEVSRDNGATWVKAFKDDAPTSKKASIPVVKNKLNKTPIRVPGLKQSGGVISWSIVGKTDVVKIYGPTGVVVGANNSYRIPSSQIGSTFFVELIKPGQTGTLLTPVYTHSESNEGTVVPRATGIRLVATEFDDGSASAKINVMGIDPKYKYLRVEKTNGEAFTYTSPSPTSGFAFNTSAPSVASLTALSYYVSADGKSWAAVDTSIAAPSIFGEVAEGGASNITHDAIPSKLALTYPDGVLTWGGMAPNEVLQISANGEVIEVEGTKWVVPTEHYGSSIQVRLRNTVTGLLGASVVVDASILDKNLDPFANAEKSLMGGDSIEFTPDAINDLVAQFNESVEQWKIHGDDGAPSRKVGSPTVPVNSPDSFTTLSGEISSKQISKNMNMNAAAGMGLGIAAIVIQVAGVYINNALYAAGVTTVKPARNLGGAATTILSNDGATLALMRQLPPTEFDDMMQRLKKLEELLATLDAQTTEPGKAEANRAIARWIVDLGNRVPAETLRELNIVEYIDVQAAIESDIWTLRTRGADMYSGTVAELERKIKAAIASLQDKALREELTAKHEAASKEYVKMTEIKFALAHVNQLFIKIENGSATREEFETARTRLNEAHALIRELTGTADIEALTRDIADYLDVMEPGWRGNEEINDGDENGISDNSSDGSSIPGNGSDGSSIPGNGSDSSGSDSGDDTVDSDSGIPTEDYIAVMVALEQLTQEIVARGETTDVAAYLAVLDRVRELRATYIHYDSLTTITLTGNVDAAINDAVSLASLNLLSGRVNDAEGTFEGDLEAARQVLQHEGLLSVEAEERRLRLAHQLLVERVYDSVFERVQVELDSNPPNVDELDRLLNIVGPYLQHGRTTYGRPYYESYANFSTQTELARENMPFDMDDSSENSDGSEIIEIIDEGLSDPEEIEDGPLADAEQDNLQNVHDTAGKLILSQLNKLKTQLRAGELDADQIKNLLDEFRSINIAPFAGSSTLDFEWSQGKDLGGDPSINNLDTPWWAKGSVESEAYEAWQSGSISLKDWAKILDESTDVSPVFVQYFAVQEQIVAAIDSPDSGARALLSQALESIKNGKLADAAKLYQQANEKEENHRENYVPNLGSGTVNNVVIKALLAEITTLNRAVELAFYRHELSQKPKMTSQGDFVALADLIGHTGEITVKEFKRSYLLNIEGKITTAPLLVRLGLVEQAREILERMKDNASITGGMYDTYSAQINSLEANVELALLDKLDEDIKAIETAPTSAAVAARKGRVEEIVALLMKYFPDDYETLSGDTAARLNAALDNEKAPSQTLTGLLNSLDALSGDFVPGSGYETRIQTFAQLETQIEDEVLNAAESSIFQSALKQALEQFRDTVDVYVTENTSGYFVNSHFAGVMESLSRISVNDASSPLTASAHKAMFNILADTVYWHTATRVEAALVSFERTHESQVASSFTDRNSTWNLNLDIYERELNYITPHLKEREGPLGVLRSLKARIDALRKMGERQPVSVVDQERAAALSDRIHMLHNNVNSLQVDFVGLDENTSTLLQDRLDGVANTHGELLDVLDTGDNWDLLVEYQKLRAEDWKDILPRINGLKWQFYLHGLKQRTTLSTESTPVDLAAALTELRKAEATLDELFPAGHDQRGAAKKELGALRKGIILKAKMGFQLYATAINDELRQTDREPDFEEIDELLAEWKKVFEILPEADRADKSSFLPVLELYNELLNKRNELKDEINAQNLAVPKGHFRTVTDVLNGLNIATIQTPGNFETPRMVMNNQVGQFNGRLTYGQLDPTSRTSIDWDAHLGQEGQALNDEVIVFDSDSFNGYPESGLTSVMDTIARGITSNDVIVSIPRMTTVNSANQIGDVPHADYWLPQHRVTLKFTYSTSNGATVAKVQYLKRTAVSVFQWVDLGSEFPTGSDSVYYSPVNTVEVIDQNTGDGADDTTPKEDHGMTPKEDHGMKRPEFDESINDGAIADKKDDNGVLPPNDGGNAKAIIGGVALAGLMAGGTLLAIILNDENKPSVGPVNIIGDPKSGSQLHAVTDWISGNPEPTVTHQWQTSTDGTTWEDIAGATTQFYIPTVADENKNIRAVVTATNEYGSDSENSNQVTVEAQQAAPTVGGVNVTGNALPGSQLTATVEKVTGNPAPIITYQWQISTDGTTWKNIAGATGSIYTPANSDENKYVRVAATATNKNGSDTKNSRQIVVGIRQTEPSVGTVTITGTPLPNSELIAVTDWVAGSPEPTVTHQWQISTNGSTWTDIAGATTASFTPTVADEDKYVRVVVTAVNENGIDSEASKRVMVGVKQIAPSIGPVTLDTPHTKGTRVQANLEYLYGSPLPTLTYTWEISPNGITWHKWAVVVDNDSFIVPNLPGWLMRVTVKAENYLGTDEVSATFSAIS